MEPVKGGTLANPPEVIRDIFESADPEASPASWAIRFAASLPNVMMVLSGMSNMEQMMDNLSFMKDFVPFNETEDDAIIRARAALKNIDSIPCTACNYCTPGCPMQIRIPVIFSCMNRYKLYQDMKAAKADYSWKPGPSKASACIKCGQCEGACPQHLPIIELLEEVAATLE